MAVGPRDSVRNLSPELESKSGPYPGADAGAAYVFDVSDPRHPIERFKLRASDAERSSRFGQSVAVSGGLAVIGAPYRRDAVNGEADIADGGAYIFDVTTGEQLARIPPQDPRRPDEHPMWASTGLGRSVGISGDTVVVGSPFAHDGNYNF